MRISPKISEKLKEFNPDNIYFEVETWLPSFPGFYNSYLEFDDSMAEEDLKEYVKDENLRDCINENYWSSETYSHDVKEYEQSVCKEFTSFIECNLVEKFVSKIELQELRSPKFYNFETDSINCKVYFSAANIKNIQEFIKENNLEWEKYLIENYKSRSGFMSFHNYFSDSPEWLIDFENALSDSHNSGAVLQFICNQIIDSESFYYACEDCYSSIDIDGIIKELKEKGIYKTKIQKRISDFINRVKPDITIKKFSDRVVFTRNNKSVVIGYSDKKVSNPKMKYKRFKKLIIARDF